MNPEKRLSVESLMTWCSLDIKGHNFKRDLRDLESELNYMRDHDYLGEWVNSGKNKLPSECKKPLKCVLIFTPPKWLSNELSQIEGRKEQFLRMPPAGNKQPIFTIEEFERIWESTGLSQGQFANNLGVSRQMINAILHRKKGVTQRISDKTREVFGYLLPA